MQERIILGIDPGFGRMGFGCIYVAGSTIAPIDYGVISTPSKDAFEDRLLAIATDLHALMVQHKPHVVVIEKLYFAKNSTTAMKVAEARGVAQLMAAQLNIPIVEFTPAQIKKAVTGDGKVGKVALQKMVKQLLDLATIPKPDDAADALAVAITASTKQW
ncbi:MAG: Holliday junction endonuclease RuvC [Candidatus Uhrbacteria bacterium GW2011_GWE2_40_58]|nr:MAG: Holliday junction endonuclease RuvC [Candidatus Uhrbacteria bacterium GW2011_GWF2_40_263]KKR67885.1 MAG: Holliday junction endonuclease RuvC [Candidatus Uhrbacteria bacterium GW2011_GWE2_40_58]OGL93752.1 MAG: crossover junction endodeoxyribonuclease RuvC [Candidatus Uhrbacteria bacterium RIFOXYA2_FULL_40_9]OGL96854.1 MAG: crossover junction endodeoxyribonuclease RuvC [Candidatus Uhrbacteria bacterium RIFOXYB2_FULL_41_18]HBK34550.1 crossover junction endodeoxyribonuclease RuvC [Candidatu